MDRKLANYKLRSITSYSNLGNWRKFPDCLFVPTLVVTMAAVLDSAFQLKSHFTYRKFTCIETLDANPQHHRRGLPHEATELRYYKLYVQYEQLQIYVKGCLCRILRTDNESKLKAEKLQKNVWTNVNTIKITLRLLLLQ